MNRTSGGDGISAELFKILKYDAVKVLCSICQQILETQHQPQESKKCSSQSQRKAMPKNVQTTYDCAYFTCQQDNAQNPSSQASIVHEARNSRCTSWIQKRQRNQGSNCQQCWIIEKAREFQKNIYCCFIDQSKAFECGSQQTGKLLKRQEYKATLHVSGSNWSRGNNQNHTWNNGLVQNWERSISRLYIDTLFI